VLHYVDEYGTFELDGKLYFDQGVPLARMRMILPSRQAYRYEHRNQ